MYINYYKINISFFRKVVFFSIITIFSAINSHSQVYNNLPESFPTFNIDVNNHPDAGYYFMSGAYFSNPSKSYTMIIDTTGMPIYFQKQDARSIGFTKQPNGLLSFYKGALYSTESKFVILDSNYSFKYYCEAANNFITDPHELIILEDNSYWIIGLDIRVYDMSQIVTGGDPEASVTGCVIQHISSNGNLLFEWNSWDHIEITDCDTLFVNLQSSSVDYVHANALSIDHDGNILMSSRHLNEITKININTGEIMWRLGGNKNQFTFVPTEECFYGQHSIRYCEESDSYLLFDNGNWHNPKLSRGVEYIIDEENLIATRINEFTHIPEIYSSAQGGIQRIDNHYTIVNWSSNDNNIVFTEFDNELNTKYEVSCIDTAFVCYRVLKFNWTHNLFTINNETLEFINVPIGDSAIKNITISNNQDYPLTINGYNSTNNAFKLASEIPLTIDANSSSEIEITFAPMENTSYKSLFSLFHSTDTSRIAQQIEVKGNTITGLQSLTNSKPLIIFPNPAQSVVHISTNDNSPLRQIDIIDIRGSVIKTIIPKDQLVTIYLDQFDQDMYFISALNENNKYYGKLIKF